MSDYCLQEEVLDFYEMIKNDDSHRYRSWEHCYKFFQSTPQIDDLACLHLGFYLASWGMYRGSSFLLQKDFTVHRGALEKVLQEEYQVLRGITAEKFSSDKQKSLFNLINQLKSHYSEYNDTLDIPNDDNEVTDTLVTKILMGTLGCIPAYDRFFIRGLREEGLSYSSLNPSNFEKLLGWCIKNKESLSDAKSKVSRDIEYPIMKITDVYFWQIGRKEEAKSSVDKIQEELAGSNLKSQRRLHLEKKLKQNQQVIEGIV